MFNAMFQCITAVSYTHLDVYKRQDYNLPRGGHEVTDERVAGGDFITCIRVINQDKGGLFLRM